MKKQIIYFSILILLIGILPLIFGSDLDSNIGEDISSSITLISKDSNKIVFDTDWNSANIELKEDTFLSSKSYDLDFIEEKGKYIIKPTTKSDSLKDFIYTLKSDSDIILLEEINPDFKTLSAYTYKKNPKDEWNEFRQIFDFDKECLINCSWDLSKDKKTLTLKFKQTLDGMNLAYTNVTACSTFATSNQNYKLNVSVSSTGTCMTFTGDNIILDCDGYDITYGTTYSSSRYGVYMAYGSDRNTLQNCNVKAGNTGNNNYPVYLRGDYENINNNNVTSANGGTTQNGIYMVGVIHTNITGNNVTTFTGGTDNIECYSSCSYNNYINNTLTGISNGISFHTNNNNNLIEKNNFFGIANSISIYNGASNNIVKNNKIQDGIIHFNTGTHNDNIIRDNWINTTGNRNPIVFGAALISNRNDIINNTIYISYNGRSGIQIQGTGSTNSNKDTSVINNTIYGINTGTTGIAIFPRSENTIVEGNNVTMLNTNSYGIKQFWRNYADPNHIVRFNNVYLNNTGGTCFSAIPNFQYSEMNWSGNYCETNQAETVYFEAACQNEGVEWTMENFIFNNTAKGVVRYMSGSSRLGLDDSICNGVWVYKYIREVN